MRKRLALPFSALICLGLPIDASAQAAEKAAPKPFYVDSTYDRFKDEHEILLSSRTAVASNGIAFRWGASCIPNNYCRDAEFGATYGAPAKPSFVERRLLNALSTSFVCIDFLFYGSSEQRASACFDGGRLIAPNKIGGTVVKRSDFFPRNLERGFREATSLEGRVSSIGAEFKVSEAELRKMVAFWEEFDRRKRLFGTRQ